MGVPGTELLSREPFDSLSQLSGGQGWSFSVKRGTHYFRGSVEFVGSDATAPKLDERRRALFSVYGAGGDPYFSGGRPVLKCEARYNLVERPSAAEGQRAYRLYATDRFAFGACDAASARYRVEVLHVACSERGLWAELEYYVPVDEVVTADSLAPGSFRCSSLR